MVHVNFSIENNRDTIRRFNCYLKNNLRLITQSLHNSHSGILILGYLIGLNAWVRRPI